MPTYLAFHEVDDVERWRYMPTRDEFFGPLGITHRTFRDSQGSNRVRLILEIPDFGKSARDAKRPGCRSDEARWGPPRDPLGARGGLAPGGPGYSAPDHVSVAGAPRPRATVGDHQVGYISGITFSQAGGGRRRSSRSIRSR